MPPTPVNVVRRIQALQWDGTNTQAVLDFLHAYPPFADSEVAFTADGSDALVVTTPLEVLPDIEIPVDGYVIVGDGVGPLAASAADFAQRYQEV